METLVSLTLLTGALLVAIPAAGTLYANARIRSAAREAALTFTRARILAIRTRRYTAVRIESRGESYRLAIYQDGNGNGVRNADIARGTDRPLQLSDEWTHSDIRIGILKHVPVPDPSSPSHRLTPLDDPIRFNHSNLCSFSPVGESTPGSLYLTDGRWRMAVVRVNGHAARIHTLYFTAGGRQWEP